MKTATFNLAKKLSVIVGDYVYMTNLGEVAAEATKYDVIDFKGNVSVSKFDRYLEQMKGYGFEVAAEAWITYDYPVKGAVLFNLQLKRL